MIVSAGEIRESRSNGHANTRTPLHQLRRPSYPLHELRNRPSCPSLKFKAQKIDARRREIVSVQGYETRRQVITRCWLKRCGTSEMHLMKVFLQVAARVGTIGKKHTKERDIMTSFSYYRCTIGNKMFFGNVRPRYTWESRQPMCISTSCAVVRRDCIEMNLVIDA